jgi:hypothetical protein
VAGSEQGRDWAVPSADYFEGVMSTTAFFANPKEIHAMPFETLSPDPKFARYEEYGFNPWRRVPLFQLVYGDCCETTWRWGDNSHRMPYLWWKKDLLAMVHARCRRGCCGNRSRRCLRARRRGSRRATTTCAAGGASWAIRRWSTTNG